MFCECARSGHLHAAGTSGHARKSWGPLSLRCPLTLSGLLLHIETQLFQGTRLGPIHILLAGPPKPKIQRVEVRTEGPADRRTDRRRTTGSSLHMPMNTSFLSKMIDNSMNLSVGWRMRWVTAELLPEMTFNGDARFRFISQLDIFFSSGKKTIADIDTILFAICQNVSLIFLPKYVL